MIEAFFTEKGGDLYAIVPGWPGRRLTLRNVSAAPSMRVSMLGAPSELKWSARNRDLVIEMPEAPGDASKARHAYVVKLPGAGRR